MTTEQYSIGYDAGYQDGFDAALAQPVKQEPVIDLSKLRHEDRCCYWDDEAFCNCGADSYEILKWYRKNNAATLSESKQEPVAVISESAIGLVKLHSNGVCLPFGTQLYTAPVSAKREWVDLTDYEIAKAIGLDDLDLVTIGELEDARAVIAADREKNNVK